MTDDAEEKPPQRLSHEEKQLRRLRAAALFARGLSQADVARSLDVSRMSVSRWYRQWKKYGSRPLLGADRMGSKPKLGDAEIERLEPQLLAGPVANGFQQERWTLALIAELIEREYGIHYHPSQVRKILNALGWFHSSKGRPRRDSKTGLGPFAWRKYRRIRGKGRREFKPVDK